MSNPNLDNRITLTLHPVNEKDHWLVERIKYDAEMEERSKSQILKRIAREYYQSREVA